MFDKLEAVEKRYDEISLKLSDPSIIENQETYRKLMKEFSDLEEVVLNYREYKETEKDIKEAEELLKEENDREFKELVETELAEKREKYESIKQQLKILLLPKDPNDERCHHGNQGGAGGKKPPPLWGAFRCIQYAELKG